MSPRCRFVHVSVFATCFVFASTARAQLLPHGPKPDPAAQLEALKAQQAILQSPNQFGTQCCQILQIPWSSFASPDPSSSYSSLGNGYISPIGSGYVSLSATVTLPSGAALDYLDLYYLDNDPNNDICAALIAFTGPTFYGDPPSFTVIAGPTCSSGSLGYGYAPIAASGTISNNVYFNSSAAQYVAIVFVYTASSNLGFKAVDIWWHRQVSPAPATATFNDVPTNHPFFQFVEALVASGITVGCQASPPLYCPDAPLTRKQMAAFLAKGYGLYWPY